MILEKLVACYRRLWWERRWRDHNFQACWLKEAPRAFVATGFEAGWLSPGMTALDIGCGLGHTAAWLAARGLQVVGVDFSQQTIRRARRLHADQPRLSFEVVDVCGANTLTATFDVLIDTGCLQAIPESLRLRYKQNLLVWSRSGSRFVVPMHYKDTPFHEKVAQVRSLFCPPFEFDHCEETPSSTGGCPKPVIHLVRSDRSGRACRRG